MTKAPTNTSSRDTGLRSYPKLTKQEDGTYTAEGDTDLKMERLMGTRTYDAASGVYISAVKALGAKAEEFASFMSATFAELEPRDAIEAMLIGQMTATHVAMTALMEKTTHQSSYQVRESCERSVTRLSRTFLAQVEALKKYRAKAQQTVRVERVTVNDGGQAIVGDVCHGGRADGQKRR